MLPTTRNTMAESVGADQDTALAQRLLALEQRLDALQGNDSSATGPEIRGTDTRRVDRGTPPGVQGQWNGIQLSYYRRTKHGDGEGVTEEHPSRRRRRGPSRREWQDAAWLVCSGQAWAHDKRLLVRQPTLQ